VPKADILRCGKERRYSIASSAMGSTPAGIVRLSAFAVLRLMTNSNLIASNSPDAPTSLPDGELLLLVL
jgi:hypothetical protein